MKKDDVSFGDPARSVRASEWERVAAFEPLEPRLLLDGAPVLPPMPPAGDGVVTRRALLVGITDGDYAWDFAQWDITTIQSALVNRGGWGEVIVLSGAAGPLVPTMQHVEEQFDYLRGVADDDDLTLFYFTGHGEQAVDSVPADEPDALDERLYFHDDFMTDDALGDIIGPAWPGQLVMIFDSCYSGGMLDGTADPPMSVTGAEMLAACRPDETALGDAFLGSYFTRYLAEALDNGMDTVREMFQYAQAKTVDEAAPHPQNPVSMDSYPGDIYLLPESASGDAWEPNDSFAEAKYLGILGDRTVNNLSLHVPGNEDFYSFTARADGLARIDVLFAHSQGDLGLFVYNQSLNQIGSSQTSTDDERVIASVTAGQVYYVRVVGETGATNRDYRLAIDGPGPQGDIYESNNNLGSATNLGQFVYFDEPNLSIHNVTDHDFYRLRPIQSGWLDVSIYFRHADGDLDMELYDQSLTVIDYSESASDDEYISTYVVGGRDYYIHVYGWQGATNPRYEMEIVAPGPTGDDYEINDTFPQASDLGTLGDVVLTDLSVHLPGNDDYYRLTAAADGMMDVDLSFAHADGDLNLYVYSLARTQLGSSLTTTDDEHVSIPVVVGQAYYVRVTGLSNATSPYYELSIDAPEKLNLLPPVAAPNIYGVNEDWDLTVNAAAGVLGNDTDPDKDPITALLIDDAAHGLLLLDPDGSFYYLPDEHFHGIDTFTYVADDGMFLSDPVEVTLRVVPVNDTPDAADTAATVTEDEFVDIVLSGSDLETPAGDLVYAIATPPAHGTLELNGNVATYTPEADYFGPDSFTFTVTDDGDPAGTHMGPGDATSPPATVDLTVEPVDDAPRAEPDALATDEDTDLLVDPLIDLLGNDFDEDLSALVLEIVADPLHGALLPNADGTFTYAPAGHYHGPDEFTYRTFDGTYYSDPALVSIDVAPVNDRPVGQEQDVIAAEDGSAVIVLGGQDVETAAGSLVFALVESPDHGQVELVGNTVTFTAEPGHHGVAAFTFTVTDDGDPAGSHGSPGDLTSAPATVRVFVPLVVEAGQTAGYYDSDGDWVTVSLRGSGTVGIYLPGYTWCEADRIVVSGSDARSTLTIAASGRGDHVTSVGEVIVNGSLNALNAPTTSLRGNLLVTGTLRTLKMDDVAADHHIDINTDGLADPTRDSLTVTLDRVADTWLDTHGLPIRALTVTEWLDGDGDGDAGSITTPSINGLKAKGSRRRDDASDGNFAAGLELNGDGVAEGRYVLNSATVAGAILGGAWNVGGVGNVNTIRAGQGTADGWSLDADGFVNTLDAQKGDLAGTVEAAYFNRIATRADLLAGITANGADPRRGTAVNTLNAASALGATLACPLGGVNSINVLEWLGGWMNAAWLGTANVRGDVIDAGWAFAGDGRSINIRGDVDNWTAALRSLRSLAAGAVGTAHVTVQDALGSAKATCWLAGALDANTLGSLRITGQRARRGEQAVPGDFRADLTVRGEGVAANRTALNSAQIAGKLMDNTCRFGAAVGTLVLGAMENAKLLVGCDAATGNAADFGGNLFAIRRITLKGVDGAYFVNSTLAAWEIGSLRFARRGAEATGTLQYHQMPPVGNDPLFVGSLFEV